MVFDYEFDLKNLNVILLTFFHVFNNMQFYFICLCRNLPFPTIFGY